MTSLTPIAFARALRLLALFACMVAFAPEPAAARGGSGDACVRWTQRYLVIGSDLQSRRFFLEPKGDLELMPFFRVSEGRGVFHRPFNLLLDVGARVGIFFTSQRKTCLLARDDTLLTVPVFFIGRPEDSLEEQKQNAESLVFDPSAPLAAGSDFSEAAFHLRRGGSRFDEIRPFFVCGMAGLLVCSGSCPGDSITLAASLVNELVRGSGYGPYEAEAESRSPQRKGASRQGGMSSRAPSESSPALEPAPWPSDARSAENRPPQEKPKTEAVCPPAEEHPAIASPQKKPETVSPPISQPGPKTQPSTPGFWTQREEPAAPVEKPSPEAVEPKKEPAPIEAPRREATPSPAPLWERPKPEPEPPVRDVPAEAKKEAAPPAKAEPSLPAKAETPAKPKAEPLPPPKLEILPQPKMNTPSQPKVDYPPQPAIDVAPQPKSEASPPKGELPPTSKPLAPPAPETVAPSPPAEPAPLPKLPEPAPPAAQQKPAESAPQPPPMQHVVLSFEKKTGGTLSAASVLQAEGTLGVDGVPLLAAAEGLTADLPPESAKKISDGIFLKKLLRRHQLVALRKEAGRTIATVDPLYVPADFVKIVITDAGGEPVRGCQLALDVSADRRLGGGWMKLHDREKLHGLEFGETDGPYTLALIGDARADELLISTADPGNAARLANIGSGCELEALPWVTAEELRSGKITRSLRRTGQTLIAVLSTSSDFAGAVSPSGAEGFWSDALRLVNVVSTAAWEKKVLARAQAPGVSPETGKLQVEGQGVALAGDGGRGPLLKTLSKGSQNPPGPASIFQVQPIDRNILDISMRLIREDAGIQALYSVKQEALLLVTGSVKEASPLCQISLRRDGRPWSSPQWMRQARRIFALEVWSAPLIEAMQKASRLKPIQNAPEGVYVCNFQGPESDKIALYGISAKAVSDPNVRIKAFSYLTSQANGFLRP